MINIKEQEIFFLGCGRMGSVVARNLVEENELKPNQVTVLEKSDQNHIPDFNYIKETSSLPQSYKADLVFLAIKPQDAEQILEKFSQESIFHEETIFVSILAGKKLSFFSKFFGEKAKIVRSMPNLPIQDAQGIFPYLANDNFSKPEIEDLQNIFDGFGNSFALKNEKMFDPLTALFGSGPAYIFYLQQIYTEIALNAGIEKDEASSLVRTLFLGSSLMSCNSDLEFSELCDSVTSKAGTTQEALNVLREDSNLKTLFSNAITAATKKSKELSS